MKAIPLQRWKDGGHGEESVVKPKCRICKVKILTSDGQMYELHKVLDLEKNSSLHL